MKRRCDKALACLMAVSLAWSLTPAAGLAYALGEGDGEAEASVPAEGQEAPESAEADERADAEISADEEDGSGEEASDSSQAADDSQDESSEGVGDGSGEDGSGDPDAADSTEPTDPVDGKTDDGGAVDEDSFAAAEDGEPADPSDEGADAGEPGEDGPSDSGGDADGDAAASALLDALAGDDASEELGDPSLVLPDAELDALAEELGPAPDAEPEDGGDVALRAQASSGWVRLWGQTALDTMRSVLGADGVFASRRGGTVVVASADGYWDALSASGLAGTLGAPVVLTSSSSLSPQARSEVARLRPSRVIVAGGPAAVSPAVVDGLKRLCPSVRRVWGADAPSTAVKMCQAGRGWSKTAIVCTSDGYWDALSAAPYAYWAKAPVFLAESSPSSSGRVLGAAALAAIRRGGFERVVIVGGDKAVAERAESQLASAGVKRVLRKSGRDAIATSAAMAKWEVSEGMGLSHMAVATSSGYWDALSAAPLCGQQGSVLVLVGREGDYRALDAVYTYGSGAVEHGHVIGGPLALPKAVYQRASSDWALKAAKASATSLRAGGSVTLSPRVEPGADGLTFNYGWSRNGSWADGEFDSVMRGGRPATADASRSFRLSRPGAYTCFVDAFDASGRKQTAYVKVLAYELQNVTITRNNDTSWTATAQMGVNGSLKGVEYRFTWKKKGTSKVLMTRDWSASKSSTFDTSKYGGTTQFTVTMEVRDADGKLGSKSATTASTSSGDAELDRIVNNILSKVGTDSGALKRAYQYIANNYRYGMGNTYPSGDWRTWSKAYAKEMYLRGWGNCYRYASLMTWVAIGLGYEAHTISGECLSGGGWTAHGWCEVRQNGKWYVIDCTMRNAHQDRDFFMKTFDNAPLYYRYL